MMTSMLSDVVNAGTAWRARRAGFTHPAAGKTGTTNDYHDAWFIGYTPYLVSGVWIGFDQPRPIAERGYAGDLAVPLWGRFMDVATRNHKPQPFRAPRTVTTATVCRLSGKLATGGCRYATTLADDGVTERSPVYTEYFARGTAPDDYCPYHSDDRLMDAIVGTSGERDSPADGRSATPGRGTPSVP
jgi:penicillin-binding protein 1A